ncbi:hypothetical protein [Nocardia carnea]|uniref:hypothetical protein n=1 Tax=Nocardia carnea TaxID=37328 RepID=UPI002454955D|nr:hypothetical protein [Nocardia carnea]
MDLLSKWRGPSGWRNSAAPYRRFKAAGYDIALASPAGGRPPLDPKSNEPGFQTDDTHLFEADTEASAALADTVRLDSVSAEDFDTVFYPGGHGPLWDLAEDPSSRRLIETALVDVVPFLVENELHALGGNYSKGADWGSYVVEDGLLITGQNPGSSAAAADALIAKLAA